MRRRRRRVASALALALILATTTCEPAEALGREDAASEAVDQRKALDGAGAGDRQGISREISLPIETDETSERNGTAALGGYHSNLCDESLRGFRGSQYAGCQTKTKSGYTCAGWYTKSNRYSHMRHGYCRNPHPWYHSTIWCYTTTRYWWHRRWEYCDPDPVSQYTKSLAVDQGDFYIQKWVHWCSYSTLYASRAWELLKSGEPRVMASGPQTSDPLFMVYAQRAFQKCRERKGCQYVSVFADASYKLHDASGCSRMSWNANSRVYKRVYTPSGGVDTAQVDQLTREKETLSTQLTAKQSSVDQLTREKTKLTTDLKDAQDAVDQLTKEKDALTTQLKDAQDAVDQLNKEKDALTTQLKDAQDALDEFDGVNIENLTQEKETLSKQLEDAQNVVNRLTEEKDALTTQLKDAQDGIDRVKRRSLQLW